MLTTLVPLNFIKNLPNRVGILITALAVTAFIFFFDLAAGSSIRLHALYLLPISFVAGSWNNIRIVAWYVLLVSFLQAVPLYIHATSIYSYVSNTLIAILASIFAAYISRLALLNWLNAKKYSTVDFVTGVINRKHFMSLLDYEIMQLPRSKNVITVAVFDLFGFKLFNSTQGYSKGDDALRLLADTVESGVRLTDVIGRLGSDELGVFMLNASDPPVRGVLENLRLKINDAMSLAGFNLRVSISFVVLPQGTSSTAVELVRRASDASITYKEESMQKVISVSI